MTEERKEYLLDDEPIGWQELIKYAKDHYGYDGFVRQTSVAARILRENGHTVRVNPNT